MADRDPSPDRPSRLAALTRGNRGLALSAGVWVLLVVNFSALQLPGGDSLVQFHFVQRMFGDRSQASAYFFGLGLAEAPFYAVGKLFHAAGLETVSGYPVTMAAVALGLGLLTVVAWPLLGAVIRGLGLGHAGLAVLAAALGTPFFYYATFVPGKSHTVDALVLVGAVYLTFRYLDRGERWVPFALGLLFGFGATVRYFNGAEAVALVAMFLLWRRFRDAATLAATAIVTGLLLFRIPHLFTSHVFSGGPRGRFEARHVITFAPLNPLRMLFTDHRGYLVWSPVALLALAGLGWLWRHRPEHRRFLLAVGAMALAMMASYAFVPFWDGGWSFGQRFYTPLFPVVAIGLAGLFAAAPRPGGAAAAVAAVWSLYLCLTFAAIARAPYLEATPGGVEDLALVPSHTHTSVGAYGYGVWARSNLLRPVIPWPFSKG